LARSKLKGVEDMLGIIAAVLNCSLVTRILGLSRFHGLHSRPADNRHSDAPPALLQR
jgi:hypothetical protein